MKVFNDLNDLPKFKNAVLTIGSFDGVHSGHQKILERLNDLAEDVGGESIVITFHPHPRQIIYPKDKTLQLLNTIEEKVLTLERYGVDNVVVIPFTVEFSQQSADEYIEKFLIEKFRPYYVVIGYDHRFGLNRQGDVNYLKWYASKEGFEVIEIEKQQVEDITVSSTKIRKALAIGDVNSAHRFLNHYYMLTGTVVHGQKIGTELGYATANLEIKQEHKLIPPTGIYAVFVVHQKKRYGGMLYIGNRPTLKEHNNRTIEVNIFDFNKSIYGDKLRLEFVDFIREDMAFDSLDELQVQLSKDQEKAQRILAQQEEASQKKRLVDSPSLAISILNYNGAAYLKQFLPSVMASTYPNYTIYVADNASTDNSVAVLEEEFDSIKRVILDKNHGFAKGYNEAMQQIDSDYYVLLNSDIEVTPGWIEPIIELMERDKSIGACQPKIRAYNQKDYFEYAGASGGWLDKWGYPFCRGRIFAITEKDTGQYDNTQEIFWATGAAFFIRAKLFHDLGGFDEDYFAHSEEIDLCWRLKRAGYKVMVRPRSVVYHVGGGTLQYDNPNKAFLNFRNSLYTLMKNEKKEKLLWLIPLRFILDGMAGVLFLFQGKFKHIRAIIRAHWQFIPRIPKLLKKRRHYNELIQKISIDSPTEEGRYRGSIVWQYYARGKRYFKHLQG